MKFLFLSVVLAGLPEKPQASDPVPGQCERAIPVLPEFISECKGVLLPTSWMADYEHLSAWSDQIAAQYKLDVKLRDLKIAALEKELEIERRPKPFWERPIVWSSIGIVMGSAIVVAGGYAIGQAGGAK